MAKTLVGCNPELVLRVNAMFEEDRRRLNVLSLSEGKRTRAEQQVFYDAAVRKYGVAEATNWAARPGYSRHEQGIAVDIATVRPKYNKYCFELATKYGLFQRLSNEPWHFEMSPHRTSIPTFVVAPTLEKVSKLMGNKAVALLNTKSGNGYWIVADNGGVFCFGDAGFYGSAGNEKLAAPIVSATATISGNGYRLLGADGGVFNYGDAAMHGTPAKDNALGYQSQ